MDTLIIYSGKPLAQQFALPLYALASKGLRIEVLPLTVLLAQPHPRPRRTSLRGQWLAITMELAAIGDQLNAHEQRQHVLDAGAENGLRARRDDLQSRQRAIQATMQAMKGEVANG